MTAYVFTGVRPGGNSSRMEMSRSPNIKRPSVRGMGVALITSVCGWSALPDKSPRWRTPKRCCSSVTTKPSFRNSTLAESTACVPTTRSASPAAIAASAALRAAPFTLPVKSAVRTPSPANNPSSVAACCAARISVGAISTDW